MNCPHCNEHIEALMPIDLVTSVGRGGRGLASKTPQVRFQGVYLQVDSGCADEFTITNMTVGMTSCLVARTVDGLYATLFTPEEYVGREEEKMHHLQFPLAYPGLQIAIEVVRLDRRSDDEVEFRATIWGYEAVPEYLGRRRSPRNW